jgi:DNA-binding transcriptional ArsR family regulator
MFEKSPLVDLAVGRSTVRQRLLSLLMDESCGRLHLRELQRRAGTSPGTASRELAKLVAAGLIEREAEGSQVYFKVSASPFATMLRSLLVAMPTPEFKPRPPRLLRIKAAPKAVETAEPEVIEIAAEPVEAEPVEAAVAPAVEAELVEAAVAPAVEAELVEASVAPAREAKIIEPDVLTAGPAEPPTSIALAVSQAASKAKADMADPVGLRVAGQLANPIKSLYGDALRGFYLYGARALGTTADDADVETIVVLDRVEHYGAELERTSHIYATLSHELKLVVSRVFVDEETWDGGPNGDLPVIRSEAVAI